MAKKVMALIKLQVPAAKATPAPPIGPALGQHGVNIPGFCKEFNDRTAKQAGLIYSGGYHRLCGPILYLYHQNTSSCRADQKSGGPGKGQP